MPIKITDKEHNEIDWLSNDEWDLPSQLDELSKWLKSNCSTLPKGEYSADIGFDIRKEAFGGGGYLDIETINLLAKCNMEVYFSEYPETIE